MNNLKELLMIIQIYHEPTFYKMNYAYAVTLMETFLADTTISLVLSKDKYLINAITKVEDLKKLKCSLIDILNKDGVKGIVIDKLSEILYHNIPKVKIILEGILGKRLDVDISNLTQITLLRHDIVHRDGKTTDGHRIKVDKEIAIETIKTIENFVESIAYQVSVEGEPE